jgi:hypothetical protein
MSLMFIRVLAGFLAGMAAGILTMRIVYKKTETAHEDESHSISSTSTSATTH